MALPNSVITKLPELASGLKPAADGETWNAQYIEIDANNAFLEGGNPGEFLGAGAVYSVPDGTGGTSGHVIENEGTPLTQKANMNFIGAAVVAATGASDTEVTINGAVWAKNIETLAATKTLTDASEPIQTLDTGGAARDVNLSAEAAANPFFMIRNAGSGGDDLTVKDDSPATIATIADGEIKLFVPDGVSWVVFSPAGAAASEFADNVFRIIDNGDGTKKISFEASGITTSTVRTITMIDEDLTILGLTNVQVVTNKDLTATTNSFTAASLTQTGVAELATTAEIDTATDNARPMTPGQFQASKFNVRTPLRDVIASDADQEVATDLAGDFVAPYDGTIESVGATCTTAGVTGTATLDIHKNGTTIMTTNKISIETTEKTSRSAAQQPVLTVTTFLEGDIFTFDQDAIQTTPGKGLQFFMNLRPD